MRRSIVGLIGLGVLCVIGSLLTWRTGAQSSDDQNQFEFVGQVTSLPNTTGFIGDWVVGRHTVHVTSSTKIDQDDGTLALNALVEVEGTLLSDGSVNAASIEVKEETPPAVPCGEFRGTIQSLPTSAPTARSMRSILMWSGPMVWTTKSTSSSFSARCRRSPPAD